jgi:hypothetical protein
VTKIRKSKSNNFKSDLSPLYTIKKMMHSLKLNNSLYNNNNKNCLLSRLINNNNCHHHNNGVHEGFKMEPREWPNI